MNRLFNAYTEMIERYKLGTSNIHTVTTTLYARTLSYDSTYYVNL
jgi:hypothetical protein